MSNIKLKNHNWDTTGVYDSTLGKTQKQINADLTANKVNTSDYAPATKTSEMTQSVGKDSSGKLWTTPVSSASIVSATETWLANNITQETGYVIDESLSVKGAAADAAATGYLKSAVINTNFDYFDPISFAADGLDYYSYDGYKMSMIKADSRAEATIAYKIQLFPGIQYAAVFDAVDSQNTRFIVYDPVGSVFALNAYASSRTELLFTVQNEAEFVVKILVPTKNYTVSNFHIVNYDLWKQKNTIAVLPEFVDGYSDDENINHAIICANIHGFQKVKIQSGSYSIEHPIELCSNVCLDATDCNFILADGANCQMAINKNMTTSATHTDKNISIVGGVWDGNHDNQSKDVVDDQGQRIRLVVGMEFAGVDGLLLEKCRIQNTRVYGALISNSNDVKCDSLDIDVGNVAAPDNADGLHFLGPINTAYVLNCKIKSEDNCLAFNADDVNHGSYTTTGLIENVYVNNLYINNYDGGQGILLLSAEHAINKVTIENVRGIGGYVLKASNFNLWQNKAGSFHDIIIRNISFECLANWRNVFIFHGGFGNVTIENVSLETIHYHESSNMLCVVSISDYSENNLPTIINKFSIKNIYLGDSSVNKEIYVMRCAFTTNSSVIRDLSIDGLTSHRNSAILYPILIGGACTILKLTLCNFYINNAIYGLVKVNDSAPHIENIITYGIVLRDRYSPYKILNPNNASITKFTCLDSMGNGYGVQESNATINNISESCIALSSLPNDAKYYNKGQIIVNPSGSPKGWLCTTSGVAYNAQRAINTSYSAGALRMYNEYLLICTKTGTSGSSSLTIDETAAITDGTCNWNVLYKGIAAFTQL